MIRLAPIVLVALATAAPVLAAQDQPQPVFKAGTELVRLDVRVTDAQGRPIKDLRPDEIELVEDGQIRPILLFQHVDEPPEAYTEAAMRTMVRDVSTNQGAARGHLYVLVFDQHHIGAGNEQRARQAAERFLRTRVRPGDRVALYALPGPGPQIPFTSDAHRVSAELVKVQGSLERMGSGALGSIPLNDAYEIVRGNEEILTRVAVRLGGDLVESDAVAVSGARVAPATGGGGGTTPSLIKEDARRIVAKADFAARSFLLLLSDLVRTLQGIEGRKSVIVFSEGFYADNVSRELEQVAAAAARSYSVVIAFDLNHRTPDMRDDTPQGGDRYSEIQSRIAPLASLAVETDGALIVDATSRLDEALGQLASQSQDYYVIGFAPPTEAVHARNAYRRINVRVKRTGLRASTRTGYATSPDGTPADRRRAIDIALRAPFAHQGLQVQYTTYTLRGGSPGANKVILSLAAELPVASASTDKPADLVFAVRRATDGHVVASGTDVLPMPSASRPGAAMGLGTYRVQFEVPQGDYLMRVVVREPGGLIGSADRKFQVRALNTRDVTASDMILGARTDQLPVRATAYATDILGGILELYAPNANDLQSVDVKVDLAPVGGAPVRSSAADLLDIKTDGSGSSRGVRIDLPLEGLDPGEYVVRATVRASGETVAELAREVDVLPGTAPAATAAPVTPIAPLEVLGGALARQYLAGLAVDAAPRVSSALSLATAGRWDAVEAALGPAAPEDPFAAHALRGLAQFADKRYGEAASALKTGLMLQPKDALTAFFMGWAWEGAGQPREAITAWRNAVFLDPGLIPAHLALADEYLKLAQPALAVQVLRAGLEARPSAPELIDKLSRLQGR